jgi:hypothetical protein
MGQVDSSTTRDFGGVAIVRPPGRMDAEVARQITDVGAMRYAAHRCGMDDYEIADEIGVSHGYMSKVLKGTAGLYGRRLVRFMRITNNIAPLQWLGDQMGCDVIHRDARAAEIAALKAQLAAKEAA